jgi:hypothetical protein
MQTPCDDFGINFISRGKKANASITVTTVPLSFLENRDNYCSFPFLRDFMCQPTFI